MNIKFCGAAQTVTGSQHLIEINGNKILLDCGLYQGKRSDAYDINKNFLFDPTDIDAVILSHAHIDHSGNLPTLYRKGFRGDIYSTPATRDLSALMLLDSAHIQQKDIEYVNKKRKKDGAELFKPLYDLEDVKQVMKLFKTISYHKEFTMIKTGDKITVEFYDAGHILGSALTKMHINENGRKIKFAYTGDIGRPNLPILNDPEFMGDVNYIISESTYGCKQHDKAATMEVQLAEVLQEAISRKGKIIVPAFSVGRTQEFLFAISKLINQRKIQEIPIYVDSPLSSNVSNIFRLHHECFDQETSKMLSLGIDIFSFPNLHYIREKEDSIALKDIHGPCIIVSASGMCESGRVLHHLANHINDPSTTILIIGFMAEHTLGRRLIETKDTLNAEIKIHGDIHIKKAKTYVLNSFSAHADHNELSEFMNKFNKNELEHIMLVHGEMQQQSCLKNSLIEDGFKSVTMPEKGEVISF